MGPPPPRLLRLIYAHVLPSRGWREPMNVATYPLERVAGRQAGHDVTRSGYAHWIVTALSAKIGVRHSAGVLRQAFSRHSAGVSSVREGDRWQAHASGSRR